MKLKNIQMESMIDLLEKYLDRRDLIGYAAARNTRILQSQSQEYFDRREELITKYGEPVVDEFGQKTGQYKLAFSSPKWPDYEKDITLYAMLEHEVDLFTIDYSEAIGILTGSELLELDWMFEEK